MEGHTLEKFEAWFVPEAHGESDEEEVLSFRDLPDTESARLSLQWEEGFFRDSNTCQSSSDQQDFEFNRSNSVSNAYDSMESYCPADDLFYKGHLLPLWNSLGSNVAAKEFCEGFGNRGTYGCGDKAPSYRTWSLNARDARVSHDTDRIHYCSDKLYSGHCSSRGNPVGDCTRSHQDKSVPLTYSDLSEFAASKATGKRLPKAKSCMKWQFFSLGLLKAPQMRLDDMRSRQRIRRDYRNYPAFPAETVARLGGHVDENSVFRRSISCKEKYTNIFHTNQPKCKSAKESSLWNTDVDASRSSKGWRMLRPLSTSINGCRTSSNSVINCSTKKCDQSKRGTTAAANLSDCANQSPANSGRPPCTPRCFPSLRGNFSG